MKTMTGRPPATKLLFCVHSSGKIFSFNPSRSTFRRGSQPCWLQFVAEHREGIGHIGYRKCYISIHISSVKEQLHLIDHSYRFRLPTYPSVLGCIQFIYTYVYAQFHGKPGNKFPCCPCVVMNVGANEYTSFHHP
jgi:hypothetical protein